MTSAAPQYDLLAPQSRALDLILCDIDGCLTAETTAAFDLASLVKVADHNRAAISRRDRPILTVCTGRPQPFAEAICRLVTNVSGGGPAICENGVWLYHPGPNIYDIDPSITAEHRHAVHALADWLLARYGPQGAEREGHGISLQPGKSASISIYHPRVEFVRELMPMLRDRLAREFLARGVPIFRVSMTGFYINCDLAHVSKGTAIDRLTALTRLPRERLAGIGDMPSDLPMRERVAFFACPANAHDDVKAVADYISPREQAEGIVDILHHLPR